MGWISVTAFSDLPDARRVSNVERHSDRLGRAGLRRPLLLGHHVYGGHRQKSFRPPVAKFGNFG
jgi:hypothetical protein